jgi:ATP-dependent DNA ligase I
VAFLSGRARQGRIGIGYAAVAATARVASAGQPALTIADVDRVLGEIAGRAGKGSSRDRANHLADLMGRATDSEQRFLRRLLHGELRQGALEGVLIEAVARAARVPSAAVRRAAMMNGDLGPVARSALRGGEPALAVIGVQILRPIQPMLAATGEGIEEALGALGDPALEYKLDGARVQVHKRGSEVRVYSRGLNEVTGSVPELVAAVQSMPARELILDGEAVAVRPDGRAHPFQVTMRRFGRKLDVAAMQAQLPLRSWFFDCLLVDGQDLLELTTRERTAALAEAVPADLVIPRLVTADAGRVLALLEEALAGGHEGLMAKSLDAPYEAGSRGASWLKLKKARTFDLVVLAAEWGSGRRRGWLSNLHLGARDPASGTFVMVGKTFKGMTDQMLAWQSERLRELETGRDGHIVWVRPELVVEIAIGDVQESPHYPGGIALRFARVKRYRSDKRPDEADTLEALRALLG